MQWNLEHWSLWTLPSRFFQYLALHRIMGYCLDNFVSSNRSPVRLGWTRWSAYENIKYIVIWQGSQSLIELEGVITSEISPACNGPRGRLPVTWLKRIDRHCRVPSLQEKNWMHGTPLTGAHGWLLCCISM